MVSRIGDLQKDWGEFNWITSRTFVRPIKIQGEIGTTG